MSQVNIMDRVVLIGGRFDGYETDCDRKPPVIFTMKIPTRDGGQIHYKYLHERSEAIGESGTKRHLYLYCEE